MNAKTVNHPAKKFSKQKNYSTKKSTYEAKLETLRRRSVRNLKQGKF